MSHSERETIDAPRVLVEAALARTNRWRARLKSTQDLLAGLLFTGFGVAALWFGRTFAVGSATRMGPGYLPTVLGWSLIAVGLIIAVRAFVIAGAPIPRSLVRPQLFIIAALVAFALIVERFGLIPATAAVVVLGALASRDMRWIETLALAVGAAAVAVVLFIYLLGQPMEPWIWRE